MKILVEHRCLNNECFFFSDDTLVRISFWLATTLIMGTRLLEVASNGSAWW